MSYQVWKAHGKKPADKNRCAETGRQRQRYVILVRLWVLLFTILSFATTAQASIPISTIEELQLIGNDPGYPLDGDYILTQNIDASVTATWNGGAGFKPIAPDTDPATGHQGIAFTGTFDGAGYIITNLTIDRPFEHYVSLFGYTYAATLKDIILNNVDVKGFWGVAALAGYTRSSTIINCGSTGVVIANDGYAGGLMSSSFYGSIRNCYSIAVVMGSYYTGGLIGRPRDITVENCYSAGIITGTECVGGFAGYIHDNCNIMNNYCAGIVSGDENVGGLAGYADSGNTITNNYSTCMVSSSGDYVGGFIGHNYEDTSSIANCYWDQETSGQVTSDGGTGRTTDAMTYTYAADTFVGWDFTNTWAADTGYDKNDGYPYLKNVVPVDLCTTDNIAPVLVINGSTSTAVILGSTYTELGATAYDICDGDLTASIIVGGDTVDTNTLGTYIITYNVSDSASNAATEITRTVIVREPDTVPPVITLLGGNPAWVECGEIYEDAWATALDNYDGDLTASLIVAGNDIYTFTTGEYTVTYNVSDSAANPAVEVTRTVMVEDTIPPVITRLGTSPVTVQCGATYTDAGATAMDSCQGNITSSIVVTNPVNTGVPGTYTVRYNVSDASTNAATAVTRTVNVVDTTAPVITRIGTTPVTVQCGSTYTDAGATAADSCGGNLTGNIAVGGVVNTSVPGTYTVTYNVSDSAANAATAVSRTVTVVDTTAPIITLVGSAQISIDCNGVYTEQGATATDACDGNLTGDIIVGGDTVDTAIPGVYVVTYNVSDSSDIAAVQRTRTMTVLDNCTVDPCETDQVAPVITLNGASVVTVECKSVYIEPGATATDNCDGNLTASIVPTNPVNTNIPGTYTVRYNVSDAAMNAATTVTRTVNVVDTTKPVITRLGTSPVTVECGATYTDAGATAADSCGGNLTGNIVVGGVVNTTVPGTYTVRYNVSDASSNAATELTRTVVVQNNCAEGEPVEGEGEPTEGEGEPVEGEGELVEGENEGETDPCSPDITPPVISRCGSNQTVSADRSGVATVPLFTSSVIAQDECTPAGALTAAQNPAKGSQVNVGSHDITITVTDTAGNTATCTATLTVTPSWRYGDANLDGNITQSDITEIMRLIAGGVPSDENALITADIDQDGTIEESDMLAVFAFIRSGGIVTEIPKNLMAHSGVDEISLLWGPVPHDNVRGYMLERKIAGNTLGTRLPESADAVYYDNDIDSVEYEYRVAVVDILGNVETFSKPVTVLGNTLVLWAPWAQGLAGDEVIAPIGIGSTRGLKPKNVSITITYDPEVVEFQGLLTTVLSKPLNYLEPEQTPGQITLIATAPQGQIPIGEGRFFDLRMKLKADIPDGCRETLISDLVILNTDSQGITTATMPGTICAGDAPWGDMNGDGVVNMDDAQLALAIITRNLTPSAEQLFLGDLNGDRRIDAADAVLILRLAKGMSINPEQNDKSVENKAFSSRLVSLPNSLSIAKGCSAVVPITVDDADLVAGMDLVISYTRADLQCDAVCPSPATAGYELTTDLGTGYVRLSFSDATALPAGKTIVAYLIVTAIGDETLEGVRPPARIRINYAELKGDLGESFRWYGDIERKDAKVTIVESGECEEIPDCNVLAGEGEVEGEITEGEGEPAEGEIMSLEDIANSLMDQFDTADINGGGWLSYSEAQAILPELTREQFNQLDANGDSILSRDELEEFLGIESGCGCCKRTEDTKIDIKRYIGDWLLIGLSLLVLVSFAHRR